MRAVRINILLLTKGTHLHNFKDMRFFWNEEKNNQLKRERSLSFERIVVAIEEGHLMDVLENPKRQKYKNQLILIVDIDGYAICASCVIQENRDYFLKTLFPSRKYAKAYNLGGKNE